jgi:Holliday junction resolvasome RuvABC endonuclease subunit
MGVDPSMSCTGVSLPDQTTFSIKPKSKGYHRLREIADHLHVAAVGCQAELVVMEGLFGVYKGEAARVVPMVHGAVILELLRLPVPFVVLNPTTLKRFATGKTTANKTDMALAALKRLGREYVTDDECDADWLRIAGRFAYGLGEPVPMWSSTFLTLPLDQLSALQKTLGPKPRPIEWPEVGGRKPWPRVALRGPAVQHAPGQAVLCPMCAQGGLAVCG